ncbi:hypothetical protein [Desulfobacter hydrogenophilus]|uniref:hypothetical protein n=1 Tax=Desulfobacter hydrogenophilus TaxID=2291 RepID=UPI001F5FD47D|nr:hypothetical protein [Desulfobacter hydrogenophilus]
MLTNSFQHIPGIGAVTEEQLWASGLLNWQHIKSENTLKISPKRFETIAAHTRESFNHLENNNPIYFADLLPAKEH